MLGLVVVEELPDESPEGLQELMPGGVPHSIVDVGDDLGSLLAFS